MFERARIALASLRVLRNPKRLEEILVAGEQLAPPERLAAAVAYARANVELAAEAIDERRLPNIDLVELRQLPPGTLGRAVADHCDQWQIDPAALSGHEVRSDGDYLIAHIRETHDIWHAVTGFASDEAGEIGLQVFYLAQLPVRLGLLLVGLANARALLFEEHIYPRLYNEIARGWLLGKRAKALFGYDWAANWHRPLAEVRAELGIDIDTVDRFIGPPPAVGSWSN